MASNTQETKVQHIHLHYKQGVAFNSLANEILYGGAAGGGKSHLMRVLAIYYATEVPNIQIYLFRRLSTDLYKNHMEGATGFRSMLNDLVEAGAVTIVKDEIRFWNGARIYLCHCQNEDDMYKYQGPEIQILLIDELTHFTEKIYRFLRGRVRLGGLQVPKQHKDKLPLILCGSNPGNLGHAWVKATFIDNAKPYEIRQMPDEDGGKRRQFIPALLEDNPSMTNNDPNYERALQGLGSPELVKAMRYGLWDVVAGAALEKLRRDKHGVRRFRIPDAWTKFTVIDWGTARPFSVVWFTVVGEDTVLKAKGDWPDRWLPKGALVAYHEWYGWNGKADEGCRMESPDVAREILSIEEREGWDIDYRVGDSGMWSSVDGPSPQERMSDATDGLYFMEKSKKDRVANYQEVRARIEGEDGMPMLYISEDCLHGWRTLPNLMLDERDMEKGPDNRMEDHWYDCLSYACASYPMVYDERMRAKAEHEAVKRQHRGRVFY